MERATLAIEGMTCGHCLSHVTQTLEGLAGVRPESVELGKAVVSYDPTVIEPVRIERALTEDGYPAHLLPES